MDVRLKPKRNVRAVHSKGGGVVLVVVPQEVEVPRTPGRRAAE
jgi:hypothetical protein